MKQQADNDNHFECKLTHFEVRTYIHEIPGKEKNLSLFSMETFWIRLYTIGFAIGKGAFRFEKST